jgi:16S rRNA (uracil1498-N3)-methyltransferase
VPLRPGHEAELAADASHHVLKVLRLRVGDSLVVFDGAGNEFAAEIASTTRSRVAVRLFDPRTPIAESPLRITLLQAISRSDRMDLTLQKATELGVHAIVPLLATRSVVRLDAEQAERKLQHWRSIVINACEQCGRGTLPLLHPPEPLAERLLRPSSATRRLLLDPSGGSGFSRESVTDIELLVGPEGGFEPDEVALAVQAGFVATRLGPRILRTETAAIASLAILLALNGDQP